MLPSHSQQDEQQPQGAQGLDVEALRGHGLRRRNSGASSWAEDFY